MLDIGCERFVNDRSGVVVQVRFGIGIRVRSGARKIWFHGKSSRRTRGERSAALSEVESCFAASLFILDVFRARFQRSERSENHTKVNLLLGAPGWYLPYGRAQGKAR